MEWIPRFFLEAVSVAPPGEPGTGIVRYKRLDNPGYTSYTPTF